MKIKEIMFMVGLIVVVVLVITTIIYSKPTVDLDEKTMQCIADNSKLIVSKTCGHCANQKNILGEYLDKFDLLYVDENPGLWEEYNLKGVPTWVISENTYPGVQSIDKLKELTGCS